MGMSLQLNARQAPFKQRRKVSKGAKNFWIQKIFPIFGLYEIIIEAPSGSFFNLCAVGFYYLHADCLSVCTCRISLGKNERGKLYL